MIRKEPMLLLEYCEGGDLRGALAADNTEADVDGDRQLGWYASGHRIALDIARGLTYLHTINVVHGDLKSLNILLTRGWEVAKIGDVGVARFMNPHKTETDSKDGVAMGTFAYAAPEMLLGIDSGVKVDIFSFGVCLWEIVTGVFATRGRLHPPVVPEQCPQEIADLISMCIKKDPDERPTARQAFEIMRDASAPLTGYFTYESLVQRAQDVANAAAATSTSGSGPLAVVNEEGDDANQGAVLGPRQPSGLSSANGSMGGGTGRSSRGTSFSAVPACPSGLQPAGSGLHPEPQSAAWHRRAAMLRYRTESAPMQAYTSGLQPHALYAAHMAVERNRGGGLQRFSSATNVVAHAHGAGGGLRASLRPSYSFGGGPGFNPYEGALDNELLDEAALLGQPSERDTLSDGSGGPRLRGLVELGPLPRPELPNPFASFIEADNRRAADAASKSDEAGD
eukprot:CAMPEP_0206143468 /NCGR_PEP_ID=MMETSP1473-20131121/20656_1 /ASSEMBLY_ACC=CAM_ASM_001109 /TAXON_ID=1461547 /ORGANISM="Stichococcus sp, Strain RCC1054" /LENGTH=452 /DNA_ID=CAMNT_0053538889 /DNA_START=33 /DNA_END=1388 /DNA_ORIENTATION=+